MDTLQLRMALAGMRMTIHELATLSRVEAATIQRIESGDFVEEGLMKDLRRALESAGAFFLEDSEHIGVKVRRSASLETQIATAAATVAAVVPVEPSPERGMALLRRGKAKNDLRALTARAARKPKAKAKSFDN